MTTTDEVLTCRAMLGLGGVDVRTLPPRAHTARRCGEPVEWVYPWHFEMKQGYAAPKKRELHHVNRALDAQHGATR